MNGGNCLLKQDKTAITSDRTAGRCLADRLRNSIFCPEVDHEHVGKDGTDELAEQLVFRMFEVRVAVLLAVEG